MDNKTKAIWITVIIFLFAIGIWPLALSHLIWFIYKINTAKRENQQKTETEIYKTAADIEHNLYKGENK